jgi:hypothetical protein
MNHAVEPFLILNDLWLPVFVAMRTCKHQQIHAVLVEYEEIVGLELKALNRRLPKLVAFMPIAKLLCVNVDDDYVIRVYTNRLERHYDGLKVFLAPLVPLFKYV